MYKVLLNKFSSHIKSFKITAQSLYLKFSSWKQLSYTNHIFACATLLGLSQIKYYSNEGGSTPKKVEVVDTSPMLERQERHNERTLTALITRNRSHNKMDAIITRGERKPARAYNSNTMPQALSAGGEHSLMDLAYVQRST